MTIILKKIKYLTKIYNQLQLQIQFIMEGFQNNFLSIQQKLIGYHSRFHLKTKINLSYLNKLKNNKKSMLFP